MQTTTELALALDTTPRTLRKFLRSSDSGVAPVSKGSRYALPTSKREVNALKKRFTAWGEAQAAAKAKREAEAEVAAPEVEVEVETDTDSLDEMTHPLDS